MQVLQVSKVYQAGRVALGEIMPLIDVKPGDYIQFFKQDDRICIQKVAPTANEEGS